MAADALPPPSSGLFLEVSFRRLLAKCQDIAQGNDQGKPELQQWQTSPVFHHYVDTLQEQLSDLESSTVNRVPNEVLTLYRAEVSIITGQLRRPSIPPYCLASPPSRQQGGSGNTPGSLAVASRLELQPSRAQARITSSPSRPERARSGAADSGGRGGDGGSSGSGWPQQRAVLSEATQNKLTMHQTLQDNLLEELVGMAGQLKSGALAHEGMLRRREGLLDDTDRLLDKNVAAAGLATLTAKKVHGSNRVNFCTTCFMLMLVGLVFIGTYIFIKATSFAGYKRSRAAAAAVAAAAGQQQAADVVYYEDL